jgi:hypothetical protein
MSNIVYANINARASDNTIKPLSSTTITSTGDQALNVNLAGGNITLDNVSSKTLDGNGNIITSTVITTGVRALDINLAGGSISIGSVSISNFPTTQAISGAVSVSNLPTTQAISGAVSVSNLPTTQTISGAVSISNLPTTQTISGAVSVSNFPTTITVNNFPTTQAISGAVSVSNFPTTITVNNFPTTQSISGAVSVSNLPTTQAISGAVSVSNFPTTITVNNFPTTQAISGSVSVSNLPTTQAISGAVSVSNFPTTQAISGAVSVSNFPTTITVNNFPTTQAISSAELTSIDTKIVQGYNTTNDFSRIGLNTYIIEPKRKIYPFSGSVSVASTGMMVAGTGSNIGITNSNNKYGITNVKPWYAYSPVATTLNYEYVNSSGVIGNGSTTLALNTWTLLNGGSFLINSFSTTNNLDSGTLYIAYTSGSTTTTVYSAQNASYYQSVWTCPANSIAWINSFNWVGSTADYPAIIKFTSSGVRSVVYQWNLVTTVNYPSCEIGYITAGESLAVAGYESVSSRVFIASIVCKSI